MEGKIKKYISKLEEQYGIRVLLAVENGARNWGLHSPISDYDIRFVYHYPIKEYVKLSKPETFINHQEEEFGFDFQGFDIFKFVKLLAMSNANIIEWLNSDIVYYEVESDFIKMARHFAKNEFNPVSLYYHYHAMGYNNYLEKIVNGNEEDVTPKAYLFTFRDLFCALYMIKHETLPSSDFKTEVAKTNMVPEDIKRIILDDIIPTKISGNGYFPKRNAILDDYLQKRFKDGKTLPKEVRTVMSRKEPLFSNVDELIYRELMFIER